MGIEKDSKLAEKLRKLEELLHGESGKQLWDIITCLRGPDSPSEKANDDRATRDAAYAKRRERKHETVEVIRGIVAPGIGEARFRQDISYVMLPPSNEWDHFDTHVYKAARALGIEVKTKQPSVKVVWKEAEQIQPPKPAYYPLSKDAYEAKLLKHSQVYAYDWGSALNAQAASGNGPQPKVAVDIETSWEQIKEKLNSMLDAPSPIQPDTLVVSPSVKIAYEKLLKGDGA